MSDEELRTFGYFPPSEWSTATHHRLPLAIRQQIKTVLLLAQKRSDGTPWHPGCGLARLPDLQLMKILEYLAAAGESNIFHIVAEKLVNRVRPKNLAL